MYTVILTTYNIVCFLRYLFSLPQAYDAKICQKELVTRYDFAMISHFIGRTQHSSAISHVEPIACDLRFSGIILEETPRNTHEINTVLLWRRSLHSIDMSCFSLNMLSHGMLQSYSSTCADMHRRALKWDPCVNMRCACIQLTWLL